MGFFTRHVQIANENNDVDLVDFVESEFLTEQVKAHFMFSYATVVINLGKFRNQ